MYFGINSDGNKVHIENSVKGDSYSCPICGTPLIRKCGSLIAHHFAHKSAQCDPWYHDNKGPWHKEMQSYFRPEQCEVRIDGKCGEFHIADVFIEHAWNKNIVIEFQHSPISIEEFNARNDFYMHNNVNPLFTTNRVIWVFDFIDKDITARLHYDNARYLKSIYSLTGEEIYADINWKRPSKIFSHIKGNPDVYIYFDIKLNYKNKEKYLNGYDTNVFTPSIPWLRTKPNGIDNYRIFIFASHKIPESLYSEHKGAAEQEINQDIAWHPSNIKGRVLPFSNFIQFCKYYPIM